MLLVSPTGSGKTALKSSIVRIYQQPTAAIAHRQELVLQISLSLAEAGVYHKIISPKPIREFIIGQHVKLFGRSFHHNQSPVAVAGVDTLNQRAEQLVQWCNQVRLWDIDEAHHVLANNKWGKAAALFPNAVGLGVTATPTRTDRRALGRSKSGLFDVMLIGPTMRDLINRGYLADYIVYGPTVSIDTSAVRVSEATGEFNQEDLRAAAHRSQITGDIVEHYLKLAPGKLGITFQVDVELAVETAAAYRQKGVPAEVISAKTPDAIRVGLMEKFRSRQILQLVNVDILGEGVDVPAVEVVSMGRPTESYSLYIQQCGRPLRPAPGKTHGMIIDHVGNVKRHRLPDAPRAWSLDDEERGRRKKRFNDEIPVTTCLSCKRAYERLGKKCPYCGFVHEPASRGAPEFVDGDLIEYSAELLAQLGRQVTEIDGDARLNPYGDPMANQMIKRNWALRQDAQRELRHCIALWAGVQKNVHHRSDSEAYRRFYFAFGVDVMTAQTLGRPEAEKLTALIRETFI